MTVEDKEQIFERVNKHEPELRKLGVKRFGLFGSFKRGQQNSGSDVDFLVEFERGEIVR
jgi:uncharacterized protein